VLIEIAVLAVAGLFAVNMGSSGLAPSFSVAMGSGLVGRRLAPLLYAACVMLGALVLGDQVAKTLAGGVVPKAELTPVRVLCVLGAATVALGIANLLRVPQSTSWVTVLGLVALGLSIGNVNTDTLLYRLLPAWITLPFVGYLMTRLALRVFYPLRPSNFRLHERLVRNQRRLRWLVIGSSCYVAIAIGANNVANAVGPVSATGALDVATGFLVMAPLFGLGALLMTGPAQTVGNEIVPMGVFAACVVSIVVATLLLFASYLGIPQSLVQINGACVFAVWHVKEDSQPAGQHVVLRRLAAVWLVTPVIAALLTIVAVQAAGAFA
jgi:sulfate permease